MTLPESANCTGRLSGASCSKDRCEAKGSSLRITHFPKPTFHGGQLPGEVGEPLDFLARVALFDGHGQSGKLGAMCLGMALQDLTPIWFQHPTMVSTTR